MSGFQGLGGFGNWFIDEYNNNQLTNLGTLTNAASPGAPYFLVVQNPDSSLAYATPLPNTPQWYRSRALIEQQMAEENYMRSINAFRNPPILSLENQNLFDLMRVG